MDTISNIRIGPRLLGGFIIVTLLMGLVGVIGFLGMNSISIGMDKVYSDGTIPLLEVSEIDTSLNSIRAWYSGPLQYLQNEHRMLSGYPKR